MYTKNKNFNHLHSATIYFNSDVSLVFKYYNGTNRMPVIVRIIEFVQMGC